MKGRLAGPSRRGGGREKESFRFNFRLDNS